MKRLASYGLSRVRTYLLTGLLVLAPTAITLYVFYRLINWMDNLLGRYLRFEAFDYNRIPGAGLLATLLLLGLVGWIATRLGSAPMSRMWDSFMSRIPGIGIVYGSTKSLGEAFLSKKEQAFKKVVLVPWPTPGSWRLGFIMGRVSDEIRERLPEDVDVVFIPHTPNPASGFVHYVARTQIIELPWAIEDGLRVIVSGGVVQPGSYPGIGYGAHDEAVASRAPSAALASGARLAPSQAGASPPESPSGRGGS